MRLKFWLDVQSIPDSLMHSNSASLSRHGLENQDNRRPRLCQGTFFSCSILRSFRHRWQFVTRTEIAHVWQTEEDFSTRHVWSSLWSKHQQVGVNIFDLDFRVKINPVEQPMSHRWILAFDNHFNHRFVILKDYKLGQLLMATMVPIFSNSGSMAMVAKILSLMMTTILKYWPRTTNTLKPSQTECQ